MVFHFFFSFSLEDVIIIVIFWGDKCVILKKIKFPSNIIKELLQKKFKTFSTFRGIVFEITKIFGKFEHIYNFCLLKSPYLVNGF
jgi:hypothetical protein